jgi:hypothetical protein
VDDFTDGDVDTAGADGQRRRAVAAQALENDENSLSRNRL